MRSSKKTFFQKFVKFFLEINNKLEIESCLTEYQISNKNTAI